MPIFFVWPECLCAGLAIIFRISMEHMNLVLNTSRHNTAAKKVFEFLRGTWQYTREISQTGTGFGIAEFISISSGSDELIYQERGRWKLFSGKEYNSSREFLYRRASDTLEISFLDSERRGKIFHTLDILPSSDPSFDFSAQASHLCSEDFYEGAYFFSATKTLIHYSVRGPKKSYLSRTLFLRDFGNSEHIA